PTTSTRRAPTRSSARNGWSPRSARPRNAETERPASAGAWSTPRPHGSSRASWTAPACVGWCEMAGPLTGLGVVDLSMMLGGPYATMLMADLGADVIKVEPPSGDGTRRTGPFRPSDGPEGLSGYFQSVNRGKHGIVLDLKQPSDVERLLELVR